MKVRRIIFFLYLLSLFSCVNEDKKVTRLPIIGLQDYSFNEPDNSLLSSILIDSSSVQSFPKATDFIDSYKIVRLNTPEEMLVGTVDKVIITKEIIFIVDKQYTQQVYAFDHNGNFKGLIGQKGEAPGQYEEIVDVNINDSMIFIMDMGMRIFTYDISGFKFRRSFEIPINANAIYPQPDGTVFISSHDLTDSLNKYIYHFRSDTLLNAVLQKPGSGLVSLASSPFSNQLNNSVLYAPAYSNKIFEITPSGLAPYCKFNFGADSVPGSILSSQTVADQLISNPAKSYSYIVGTPIVHTDSNFIARVYHQKKLLTCFIEKNSGRCKTYTGITDNIFHGGLSDFAITAFGKELVYVLDPEPMKAYWYALNQNPDDLNAYKNEKPILFSTMQQMKSNENPILIFSQIKK